MIESTIKNLAEKIKNEKPLFGDLNIKFVFHGGNLTRYDFSKTEINLIKEDKAADILGQRRCVL